MKYMHIIRNSALILLATLSISTSAQAAWPNLPVACLPERASPWINGKSEAQQAPCHCPPTEMCPKTEEEYENNNLAKLPMTFVRRCCSDIPDVTCPDGSPLPADGKCTPITNCPNKYYPSLAETKIFDGGAVTNNYKQPYTNKNFAFNSNLGMYGWAYTARLGKRLNWSLRMSDAVYWVWGPMFCTYYGDGAGAFGGGDLTRPRCAFDAYNQLTDGVNTGYQSLNQIVGTLGAETLTWFGISVAKIEKLPDNLATDEVLAEWNGRRFLEIANNSANYGAMDNAYQTKDVAVGGVIEDTRGELVRQCRKVQGEFLEIEYKAVQAPPIPITVAADRTGKFSYTKTCTEIDYNNHTLTANCKDGGTDKDLKPTSKTNTVPKAYQCRSLHNTMGQLVCERDSSIPEPKSDIQLCPYLQCRYIYESTWESCLAGDVKITLADGSVKPVKDLVVGDAVQSATGTHAITATNQYRSKDRILYGINGSDALITGDHPIRTTKGWTVISDKALELYKGKEGFAATKLAVGDTLITLDGEIPVTAITKVRNSQPIATYNIKIEGNNSFYANGIEVKGFDSMQMNYK